MLLYPLRLLPALKELPWGGTKLKTKYHKETELESVAESVELAADSVIASGDDKGTALKDYIAENMAVLGTNAERFNRFPLLVKLIDAASDQPIRVHPTDECARKCDGERSKAKLWYIIEARRGASIICGMSHDVTREEIRRNMEEKLLDSLLQRVTVRPGDIILIEPGTIHAVGAGVTLAEISESADTTYGLAEFAHSETHDDENGVSLEKAMDAINLAPMTTPSASPKTTIFLDYETKVLASTSIFTSTIINLHGCCRLHASDKSFQSLLVVDGAIDMDFEGGEGHLRKGDSLFIPADAGRYRMRGKGKFIITEI